MFDNYTTAMRVNNDKIKGNYSVCNTEMEEKRYVPWSPLEKNKFLTKNRYVSCSRSVPRRNKRFARYNMSRSLNFDVNVCGSSSENSSFEEDRHMSRSSKIMKALNFHTSPLYFGKTKIKKSLNFNLTPSPKRFSSAKKSIQKACSLNFSSALSISSKCSSLIKDTSNSANSSIVFSSSESIDENQNETPLRRRVKKQERLHFSTPNTKLSTKSSYSVASMPLLRSRLKESIDDVVYITATTPNSQSLKCFKANSKCFDDSLTSTSRNLFHEFREDDDDRPQTPENVICIVPESMSAIKRSHKKERSSRRSDRCSMQLANSSPDEPSTVENTTKFVLTCEKKRINSDFVEQCSERKSLLGQLPLYNSKDDISDTGSLFDYAEELKSEEVSGRTADCDIALSKFHECNIKATSKENVNANNLPRDDVSINTDERSVTPGLSAEVVLESQNPVTPENRTHFLQRVVENSIKKSHKKNKEVNKTRFLGVKVLDQKIEVTEEGNGKDEKNFEQNENVLKDKSISDQDHPDISKPERACTPEKVQSSRLLLSQFSSVKKSHKKDKHTSILSGFLKRQEYFNKEMNSAKDEFDSGPTEDVQAFSELNTTTGMPLNLDDFNCSLNDSSDKSSPSKRKIPLNESSEHDTSISCDSELQELDTSQEEFQIFTPLKRKRWLISPNTKGYLHFYDLPSGKDEYFQEGVANIGSSRCLTPILNFQEHYEQSTENRSATNESEISDIQDNNLNNKTGRSTPRNMSTAELYSNLDSIKKSHKKNKRENNSRKCFDSVRNDYKGDYKRKGWHNSSVESRNESLEKFEFSDIDDNYLATDCILGENDDEQGSGCVPMDKQNAIGTSTEIAMQNVTPPNCLKTKNYIKLLRETSIKRSHKKVRDQKKHEVKIDPNELSDDGSIFGDEEKLIDTEYPSV